MSKKKKIDVVYQLSYDEWRSALAEIQASMQRSIVPRPIFFGPPKLFLDAFSTASVLVLRHRKNRPIIVFMDGKPCCEIVRK